MKMYNLGHMDQDIRSPDVKDYKCARCITCSTSSLSINFNIFSKKKKKRSMFSFAQDLHQRHILNKPQNVMFTK